MLEVLGALPGCLPVKEKDEEYRTIWKSEEAKKDGRKYMHKIFFVLFLKVSQHRCGADVALVSQAGNAKFSFVVFYYNKAWSPRDECLALRERDFYLCSCFELIRA